MTAHTCSIILHRWGAFKSISVNKTRENSGHLAIQPAGISKNRTHTHTKTAF
jgi:hypothetical protein